jgi:mannonate dehydratase
MIVTAWLPISKDTDMREGWRWFGPNDPVSLDDVRQAGAKEIVTALHQVPIGEAWTERDVRERKSVIEGGTRSPLLWTVVESIPIPDDVKRGGSRARQSIEAWISSMEALAASEIRIICYNFMPVIDWCRTDLEWELPNGARALRFDQTRFAAFDLHILARPGAEADYSEEQRAAASAPTRRWIRTTSITWSW